MTKQYQINGIIVGCSLEYYERHDCRYVSGGEVGKLPYGRGEAPQIKAAIKAFAREEKLEIGPISHLIYGRYEAKVLTTLPRNP